MTKFFEYYKEQGIHIHLLRRFINIYARYQGYFPQEIYLAIHIPVTKSRYTQIKLGCWLFWRRWLQFGISFYDEGIVLKFLGLCFAFHFPRKEIIIKGSFNDLTDLEDDFIKFEERSGSLIMKDRNVEEIFDGLEERYNPDVYKNFYISKYLKIYTEDMLNKDAERVLEVALPKLYYLAVSCSKDGDLLGFIINFIGSPFFEISLLSRKISLTIAKNKLSRQSNLFSCASIDRYFALKGNKINPQDKNAENLCFTILKAHNKYAQFKHLMKYIDVEQYIKNPRNWHFGRNIHTSRGLDQFIADLGIKYGIFKDRTVTITPKKEAEDALVQDRIKAWRDKLLKKEVQNG